MKNPIKAIIQNIRDNNKRTNNARVIEAAKRIVTIKDYTDSSGNTAPWFTVHGVPVYKVTAQNYDKAMVNLQETRNEYIRARFKTQGDLLSVSYE